MGQKKSTKSNKIVGYIRVSTDEQANEGYSLEAQESQIRAYATMRGLELLQLVEDPGVSAGKKLSARQGGQRVLELVNSKQVVGVVAWKLDRLFRDCAECLTVVGDWDQNKVALHLVDMGGQTVDTSTAMGRFFLTVMAGAAELERNLIRERTKLGMATKRAKGELVGGVPFGYRLAKDEVTLIPHPKERKVLTRMRRMRTRGMSLRAIVDKLNDDNVASRGKCWHLTTVANLLRQAAN